MKASVLLLTHNEARNLPRCLDSLVWCDDITIVDSGSTDGTLDIARDRDVRILHRPFDNFASQRNFGLAEAGFRNEWVLHLDADEVTPKPFVTELMRLDSSANIDAYRVPSKFIMHEKWLKHASMYPVYQVRLGRIGMRFRQVGHGQRENVAPDRIGTFDEPYLHYGVSTGIGDWLRKHVRYAADEAEELVRIRKAKDARLADLFSSDPTARRRATKHLSCWLPLSCRPMARFIYVYGIRLGLLDGYGGLVYSGMLATYEAMISILAHERLRQKGP